MSEVPSQLPFRRFLSGGAVTIGLFAALCAGGLDLALSLWLENPAGLRSGPNLLLTLAASIAIAFAAWLAAYVSLKLLLRSRSQPLVLPLSASLLTAVLLRGALPGMAAAEAPLDRDGTSLPLALLLDRTPAPVSASARRQTVPHVILLSIDTLRADTLACSGAPAPRAPHLNALAGDSLCFARATSSAAWTLPAVASWMTGVSPLVHGAVHLRSRVPDGLPTLAEVLRHAGYRTAAFVSSTVLGPQANLAQGFDEFHAWPGPWLGRSLGAAWLTANVARFRQEEAPPPELADAATGWLRSHRDEPFFLWVHTFDPHAPYGPPPQYLQDLQGRTPPPGSPLKGWRFEGWDEEAIRAGTWVPTTAERVWIEQLYLAEVRWVDDAVGRLVAELKRLGLYDEALILVVSDHGEEFWEHGSYGHGHTLYEELLHVPLLVKLPGGDQTGRIGRMGRIGRIATPVSTASLYATVLDACGVARPANQPAAGSLLAVSPSRLAPPLLSLGLNRYEDRRALRFGRFKYIRWMMSGREELYDLERDPGETVDLAERSPAELAEGRRLLADLETEARRARQLLRLPAGEAAEVDRHTLERLRSLGYAR